jgi:TRAP-type C4-dicarboxylate transport system permease small subunit
MVTEVLGRKLFNSPIPGAIDWIEVWMATFAFLGIAYCQRKGAHVRMELVMDRLKGRVLFWAECFAVIIGFVFVTIMAGQTFNHFLRAWEKGDSTIDIRLELWPSKLIVPIALTLLAVRLAINIWGYLRLATDPNRAPLGVPERHDAATEAREEIEHAMGHDARDRQH